MKKILIALFTLLSLNNSTWAANSATNQSVLPITFAKAENQTVVTPVVVTFDTTGSDLTVYTPASGNMACLVGASFSDSTAANLTIKDGSTSLVVWELAAYQGLLERLDGGVVLCGTNSNAIKMQVSAVISTMVLYFIEAPRLRF